MPARICTAGNGAKRAFPPARRPRSGGTRLGAAWDFCFGRAMKLAALLFLLLPVCLGAEEEGFVPLFDGKTLDGWVNVNCQPTTWRVVDGMIHCAGQPTGALRTGNEQEIRLPEMPGAKAKGWNRLTATRRGATLALSLNGAGAGEIAVPADKLTPVLDPGGAALSYAHIFLK